MVWSDIKKEHNAKRNKVIEVKTTSSIEVTKARFFSNSVGLGPKGRRSRTEGCSV